MLPCKARLSPTAQRASNAAISDAELRATPSCKNSKTTTSTLRLLMRAARCRECLASLVTSVSCCRRQRAISCCCCYISAPSAENSASRPSNNTRWASRPSRPWPSTSASTIAGIQHAWTSWSRARPTRPLKASLSASPSSHTGASSRRRESKLTCVGCCSRKGASMTMIMCKGSDRLSYSSCNKGKLMTTSIPATSSIWPAESTSAT